MTATVDQVRVDVEVGLLNVAEARSVSAANGTRLIGDPKRRPGDYRSRSLPHNCRRVATISICFDARVFPSAPSSFRQR
jgi:hypothetical protein